MKELIRKILKEEKMNPIKKFFFDHWDEMREHGEYPTIDYSLIGKLGFRKRAIEIHNYYIEYIGGEKVGEENLMNFLTSETFDSDDFSFKKEWNDENLKFTFNLNNVQIVKNGDDREIEADVDILEGYIILTQYVGEFYDDHEEIRYDISRKGNDIDDMSTYYDVMEDLKILIQSFIIDLAIKYGTEYVNAEVEILK
jgi:hypothetical protein